MYQASIPQFKKMLSNLSAILKKAEAHSTNKKINEKVMLPVGRSNSPISGQVKLPHLNGL